MGQKDSKIRRNLVSSLVYQAVLISLSFLLPRLYLENFGSEVNGVLSTIKQIFTYLLLLEAGVGLATTQALYKRLGQKDLDSAGAVLSATHRYYVKTGFVYLAVVLGIAVVYAYLVPSAVNSHVLFLYILLTAAPTLFSYFVQAKYRILMEADGRKYVINNAETVLQIASGTGKLLVLLFSDSLILIQLVYCIIYMAQLVYLTLWAKKEYKWLDLSKQPDFEAISQKNSVLLHQISGMVFNNTDVILISLLCDFKAVSVYAIYQVFFSQVQNFITSVTSSFNFALGQEFHKDRENFDRIYKAYETVYLMTTFFVFTMMGVFLLPVIQIYTGGIDDAEYTNPLLLFLFVLMNLLSCGKMPSNGVIEYAGCFERTRSHALWEMGINLSLSVVFILLFGISGAILGTVAALCYRSAVSVRFANKTVLGRSCFETYRLWLVNGAVFTAVMLIFSTASFSGYGFLPLVGAGLIYGTLILFAFLFANLIFNRCVFQTLFELFKEKRNKL